MCVINLVNRKKVASVYFLHIWLLSFSMGEAGRGSYRHISTTPPGHIPHPISFSFSFS